MSFKVTLTVYAHGKHMIHAPWIYEEQAHIERSIEQNLAQIFYPIGSFPTPFVRGRGICICACARMIDYGGA